MNHKLYSLTLAALMAAGGSGVASAGHLLRLPMDVSAGALRESVSGSLLEYHGNHDPENPAGASGAALRLDGYSTFAQGEIPAGTKDAKAVTFSIWIAPQTYPIIEIDTPNTDQTRIAGTLDEAARGGWEFRLGKTGNYSFQHYSGGWKVTVSATDILPRYEWSHLVAVCDGNAKTTTLYRNGIKVGEAKNMGSADLSATTLTVGKSPAMSMTGPFHINTVNGLVDELEIQDKVLTEAEIKTYRAENKADLSVPASRFEGQLMRPLFHGMPDANWTNECHGMAYADGRWHLYFQKNANGPFMARLHWGHISSADLCSWREEPIAFGPDQPYDIKGCWSGAIINDPVVTGSKPAAIYTAVDYGRATICMAKPTGAGMTDWSKPASNPLVDGRPAGLSDDFRDPNFFRRGDDCFIIVGSSKDGVGTTTLHKYNTATGKFSNDGRLFFTGLNATMDGTFWEMPTINEMADGRWLFTATPLGTSAGVRCQYWVGSINADGTFKPDHQYAKTFEMNSKDGYGLLSPTIVQHDGKTIALGIVPDKLNWERNYELGWAHCYSLPRELSLDSSGRLLQRPYSGLTAMRGDSESIAACDLNGEKALQRVSGRHYEVDARFTVGSAPVGLKLFKNGNGEATLTYANGTLTADFTGINRWVNDDRAYGGIYRMTLGEMPAFGSELKLNVFVDGSIIDIFVNDKWAQSIRVFATDADADGIAAFSTGEAKLNSLTAWRLTATGAGIDGITADAASPALSGAWDLTGRPADPDTLSGGIYVVDGRKIRR